MISRFLASIIAALFVISALSSLAGCNTVEGAGKDIEQGGRALKNEASEHK